MSLRDRVQEVRRVRAGDLLANPRNFRRHTDGQRAALAANLDEIGYAVPAVGYETPGGVVLIDGHLRAETVGPDAEIPVVIVDVSEAEADRLLLTIDPLAAMAETDRKALWELADHFKDEAESLSAFFDDLARREPHLPAEGLIDPDAVPEVTEPATKPGDLWLLGEHRLLCGDATKPEDVARLLDGERASLLATDPPYLMNYQGVNHPQSWHNRPDVKDKHWDDYHDPAVSAQFFSEFLRIALGHCIERVPVYQWHADLRRSEVLAAWTEAGLLAHQVLIWVKARSVLSRSHYMWQHEACLYGWPRGKMPKRKPPANARSIWQINQQGESDGTHPTQKPVEIFARPIEYHTVPGDICYEPFAGSGTQIIAAERQGRRCYAMEIEPKYVDVAVRRWEAYVGRAALLA